MSHITETAAATTAGKIRGIQVLVGGGSSLESAKAVTPPEGCSPATCRLDGKRCSHCTTAAAILERAGLPKKIIPAPKTDESSPPPQLPPLERERLESDDLALSAKKFIDNLKTFERAFLHLLHVPLSTSKEIAVDRHKTFSEKLACTQNLRKEHGLLLKKLQAPSHILALTPEEQEAFDNCVDTLGKLSRISRFLINYFDTVLRALEYRVAIPLVQLHKKTNSLIKKIFENGKEKAGPIIADSLRGRVQILTFGEDFEGVAKSLELPKTGISTAQRRAFENLQNEIKMLILLNGAEHVIPHYFAHITPTSSSVFLERAECDFYQLIFEKGIKRSQLQKLLKETLIGLAEAHRREIIHNDVKLRNVLIKDGAAYLADFGIAKFEGSSCPEGTRVYSAPERAAASKKLTKKSDIWSFGILCFVALTGSYPFSFRMIDSGEVFTTQKRITDQIQKQLNETLSKNPARIHTLDPDGTLQKLIFKTLLLKEKDRPSAEDLLGDFP